MALYQCVDDGLCAYGPDGGCGAPVTTRWSLPVCGEHLALMDRMEVRPVRGTCDRCGAAKVRLISLVPGIGVICTVCRARLWFDETDNRSRCPRCGVDGMSAGLTYWHCAHGVVCRECHDRLELDYHPNGEDIGEYTYVR